MSFLPVTKKDMETRGWEELDFLFVSGDAYVDHPSFGCAIITRVLEREGFKVGVIAQPDWRSTDDFKKLGRPRFGALVSSGVIDSMVNHYTASKKPRTDDRYSPGGTSGARPDRALIVYTTRIKEAWKGLPVIIGGIEASLRRFAHYDYWSNAVRRSILLDSKADLLVYGMGERTMIEIAHTLAGGKGISECYGIRGIAYVTDKQSIGDTGCEAAPGGIPGERDTIILPSYEDTVADKRKFAIAFLAEEEEQDPAWGKKLVQYHGERAVVQNPPQAPLTTEEMDGIYALRYERAYHPMYEAAGGIPAIEEVKFGITSHRGCFGACSFCALRFHQGKIIAKRSEASIIAEARELTATSGWKGNIHDVGGPTANFRNPACKKQATGGSCRKRQCLFPEPCKNLEIDHKEYARLLKRIMELPGVKHVFIRSGIRYDYLALDKDESFFRQLCEHHVSGQLKVAPEHVSEKVLGLMHKPSRALYDRFVKRFFEISKQIGKEQYLVPYLISGHPGSDLDAAIELSCYLRETGYIPEQVQDFYPTPGTASTCMYYTGLDPYTLKSVYVPHSGEEKAMQRALLQFRRKENYELVHKALSEAGRTDLIGFSKECLIWPRKKGMDSHAGRNTGYKKTKQHGKTSKKERY
jgi:uncharacterized radical SAM protein YgiQ